jgi:hypothetical protein
MAYYTLYKAGRGLGLISSCLTIPSSMAVKMVFQIMILLLCSIDAILYVQATGLTINSSCQAICGDVSFPYPFGIGAGCHVDRWFEVVCKNHSSGSPKPFLSSFGLEVLDISVPGSTVRVNYPTFSTCTNSSSRKQNAELANSPFIFSQYQNIFVVMGCDNSASMRSSDGSMIGCTSRCDSSEVLIDGSSCDGTDCCQTTIASDLNAFETTIDPTNSNHPITNGCKSAFLVEKNWSIWESDSINTSSIMSHVPVVLEWGILETSKNSLPIALASSTNKEYYCQYDNSLVTLTCYCRSGFEGNPYLVEGCGGKVFIATLFYLFNSSSFFLFVLDTNCVCLHHYMSDINECEEPGRVTSCSNNGYCVNTYGSYTCGIGTKRQLTIGMYVTRLLGSKV